MKVKHPVFYLVAFFCGAGLLAAVSPPSSTVNLAVGEADAVNPAVMPLLTGSWSGSWTDTLYGVTGPMTFVIWPEGNTYVATGTIDVSSLGLGVLPGSAVGTDNGAVLSGTFNCTSPGAA